MDNKRILNKKLGDLLVERGIIKPEDLERALDVQQDRGGLIGELLVEMGFTTEEEIAKILTAQYGFAYLPLANYEIDADLLKLVPERVARQYCLIPVDKVANNLTIAMSNPLNNQAVEDVETISGCTVQVFVSTATDVKSAIENNYKDL